MFSSCERDSRRRSFTPRSYWSRAWRSTLSGHINAASIHLVRMSLKMKRRKIIILFVCVSASLRLCFPVAALAQVRPVNDYGALGLGQLLRKLQTTGSVMMIGAHPDDEDSALLA